MLKTEVSELHKSKRQLMEIVEQKDEDISEKNVTIKSYLDKIVSLVSCILSNFENEWSHMYWPFIKWHFHFFSADPEGQVVWECCPEGGPVEWSWGGISTHQGFMYSSFTGQFNAYYFFIAKSLITIIWCIWFVFPPYHVWVIDS